MNLAPVLGIEAVKLNRLANYVLLGVLLLIYGGVVWSGYYTFSRAGLDENTVGMFFHNVLQVEGSFVGLFVALFVIINIGKEYADGTLRKNIIDGYSRQQFFTGKLAIMFLAALGVFMVPSTRCPVSLADRAMRTVSVSRSSPTTMTSASLVATFATSQVAREILHKRSGGKSKTVSAGLLC